VLHGLIIYNCL